MATNAANVLSISSGTTPTLEYRLWLVHYVPSSMIMTVPTRLWLVKGDHDMVMRALHSLEVRTPTRIPRRKLELSHLTPVKGSHLQDTDQCITAESRMLYISKCSGCGELVQPSNPMIPRTCLLCRTQLDYPVEYTINEDIIYDETVLEKYKGCISAAGLATPCHR